MDSESVGLYLNSTPLREAGGGGGGVVDGGVGVREIGQGEVTQAYYPVVQNKLCLAYTCGTDVKGSSLQKPETWLIYPEDWRCLLLV